MARPAVSVSQSSASGSRMRALAHPLRLRMLSLMTGAPFSAAELGRELGISQALASYHLRQLRQADLVELTEERTRRGGRERRFAYRSDIERSGPAPHDEESPALVAEAIAGELRRRGREAEPGRPRVGVDAELWVAPDDWRAATGAIQAAAVALHERARAPRSPDSIRVSVSAFLFEMAPRGGDAGDG